ncbi:sugar ABC transporter substrate-binding protein [Clostridia bacterium]|nr:sugar ABC transporter substrate-binding protein [Clostridia bacterium]
MKKLLVVALVLVMVFTLAACAKTTTEELVAAPAGSSSSESASEPAAEEDTLTIGFANLTDSGDYMVWVKKGMQQAADAAGVKLICVDNEADGAKAVQNIDTLISSGVDAVIEYMNDSTVNSQIKDMLDEAGIPCVAVDIPVENAAGKAAYMGGDNYKAGFICGENLGQAALDKWDGVVDLFISVETMSNGETNTLRNGGILDGIRSKVDVPDDKVVHVDGKDQTAEAQKVVTDALTANPNATHILIGCHQDDETQGAFAAVEIANRQADVLLAGCGPFGSTFENLRKPEPNFWIGSASFSPEQYGPVAIPIAIALAKGESVPEESFVSHYFLTQANFNNYYPE